MRIAVCFIELIRWLQPWTLTYKRPVADIASKLRPFLRTMSPAAKRVCLANPVEHTVPSGSHVTRAVLLGRLCLIRMLAFAIVEVYRRIEVLAPQIPRRRTLLGIKPTQ